MGRAWGPLSLRQRAGVALAAWAIAFAILAVAAAIPSGPTAVLTVDDAAPVVEQTVHFDASLSKPHDQGLGRIVAYRFDFGDGSGTQDLAIAYASHAYADVGRREARVIVRDARDNVGTATLTIDVRPKPPPTGPSPDLAPIAAAPNPLVPTEGQVVSVVISITNRGGASADSATIDVYDERPNGTTVAIGQTSLPGALPPGASVEVYSPSFLAVGVGNHTLRIVVGNVSPAEIYVGDNVLTRRMRVDPASRLPPEGGLPLSTLAIIVALLAAAVASAIGAALLLRRPRERGPLEPPPVEPPDETPPPLQPR